VAVTNNAWMNELAMMELELVRVINEKSGARKVDRIRWRLVR
jgi:predicted nucleic acid-binding Zn ribbon protein